MATLKVRVLDPDSQPLSNAKVELSPAGVDRPVEQLAYQPERAMYLARAIAPGQYRMLVSCRGFQTQQRSIAVGADGSEELVVLGKRGMRYFSRGRATMPFQPRPDMIAVKLREADRSSDLDRLLKATKEWDAEEYTNVPKEVHDDSVRVYTVDAKQVDHVLAALERAEEVELAGAIVAMGERSLSFLTNELLVRFREDPGEPAARERLSPLGLTVLRKVPYMESTYHLSVAGPANYRVLDLADEIARWPEVDWVEPNLVTTVELDQVTPSDFLWPGVWDRQLVNTPGAWAHLKECGIDPFGSPQIIVAFVDQGIESVGGVPAHPEFQGEVSDGSSKTYKLYDFRNLVPNNDSLLGDHGMGVSGVGAAKANNDSIVAGQDEGIAGAAPGCRVMGLIYPTTEADQLDMYVWAAGFNPGSPRPGFPAPISPGADVFSTSIGFGAGSPISGQAAATFDFLVANGRGGRGCLCFFSAGNANNDFTTYRPWAAYTNTFGMAASTLDDDGVTEIRAPYSGYGPAELCAPSHDVYVGPGTLHNPPQNYATWSTAVLGQGNLVGHAGVQTLLTAPAAVGALQLIVSSAFNFLAGGQLLVGLPGTPGSEPATITGAPDPVAGTIPISALMNPHPAGTSVVSGANNYRNNFGGTSSATPLAAGVAALVLSAHPQLTFAQARQILRDTAVKIQVGNADPIGQWLDGAGNPSNISGNPPVFSQWFGYGRIDAGAAVKKASEMKAKAQDRISYRYIVKFMCGESDGEVLAKGHYFTAINVHNPSDTPAILHKKISVALPGEPGHVTPAGRAKLGPCESFEIDCPDIRRYAKIPGHCLFKGFVIVESRTPLEVVAVYSASGADGQVETAHTERVPPRQVEREEEEQPELPDLVPIPPFPAGPPSFPHLFCKSRTELAVIVRNQGNADAPASKLRVDFLDCNQAVTVDVPPVGAAQDSPMISVPIPPDCWRGELMRFRITVNATMAFNEANTTNNSVQSSCVIHL